MQRKALTLIELLVVILIISVLIAITLPAVQAVRETSRSIQCSNNLRQMGLAIIQYESVHQTFPAKDTGNGFSAQVALLPLLEQQSIYSALNFATKPSLSWDQQQITVANAQINMFLCPSDRGGFSLAKFNYPGCTGWNLSTPSTLGFFPLKGPVARTSNVRDGLSHTIAFSEWLHGSRNDRGGDAGDRRLTYHLYVEPSGQALDQYLNACRSMPGDEPGWDRIRGDLWISSKAIMSSYNHNDLPNTKTCTNDGENGDDLSIPASSFHPSGIHMVFGDGHTARVANGISLPVWRALSTRSGGESQSDTY